MSVRYKQINRSEWFGLRLALPLFLVLIIPDAEAAPCAGDLTVEGPAAAKRQFDPITDKLRLQQSLRLRNRRGSACDARIAARVAGFSANWPPEAELVIRDPAGKLMLRAARQGLPQEEPVQISIPAGEAHLLQLNITLDYSETLLRAGSYQAAIDILAAPAGSNPDEMYSVHMLSATFEVQPAVRMSLSETTPGTTISLGKLRPGVRGSFAILVTATDSYNLTVRSQNGWSLLRTNASQNSAARAPYHFTVDGEPISDKGQFDAVHARLPTGTRAHVFEVTTGEFGVLPHGKYKDYVTVTVAARP